MSEAKGPYALKNTGDTWWVEFEGKPVEAPQRGTFSAVSLARDLLNKSYEAGFLAGRLDAFEDAARLSAEYKYTSVGATIMNGINDMYLATQVEEAKGEK